MTAEASGSRADSACTLGRPNRRPGLQRRDSAMPELDDTVVASANAFREANERDIRIAFQSYAVWPSMTVFEHAAFPLRLGQRRRRGSVLREAAYQALEHV